MTHVYSRKGNVWNLSRTKAGGVGGPNFVVSNLSAGYHGIMHQMWEHFMPKTAKHALLVGESKLVCEEFKKVYPHIEFTSTDLFVELRQDGKKDTDIKFDLCKKISPLPANHYDLILNQANLEHMYNPFQAMENLFKSLKPGGIVVTHTHPPNFIYHAVPRDYMRFWNDWWYDLPQYVEVDVVLEEVVNVQNQHVFSCYVKNE